MDRSQILSKVIDIVNDTLDIEDSVELDESTNLKDLGADSFDLLELVTALEDEFELTMDDEAVEKIATIGQVVDAIENAQ
ncbi:acyl carrier protein [Paratractidigestivibacter sp.]|uniref:acyl carrier protein n=1 Tax=Paratractidigestivibacter sp. TaxID=2847316 RepID=UPI002ABDA474|nr:acyl carrier protein [Paratractidigestivibacter sp.]